MCGYSAAKYASPVRYVLLSVLLGIWSHALLKPSTRIPLFPHNQRTSSSKESSGRFVSSGADIGLVLARGSHENLVLKRESSFCSRCGLASHFLLMRSMGAIPSSALLSIFMQSACFPHNQEKESPHVLV